MGLIPVVVLRFEVQGATKMEIEEEALRRIRDFMPRSEELVDHLVMSFDVTPSVIEQSGSIAMWEAAVTAEVRGKRGS